MFSDAILVQLCIGIQIKLEALTLDREIWIATTNLLTHARDARTAQQI